VNVKSIWVYYLLSGGADILTGDMLLWLSHTDVCSARDEQSVVAVGVVWLWSGDDSSAFTIAHRRVLCIV
jgi:hypothetical protein